MVGVSRNHGLECIGELEGAIVLDLELLGGVVLALLAVDDGPELQDTVFGVNLQHRPHAMAPERHLHPRTLRSQLQDALVDLYQLRLELDGQLARLVAHGAHGAKHGEALVLRQCLHLQLLRVPLADVVQHERAHHALLRRDLAKVHDGRLGLQDARQDAGLDAQVRDLLRLLGGRVAAHGASLRHLRPHADRQLPGGVDRVRFVSFPAAPAVGPDLLDPLQPVLLRCAEPLFVLALRGGALLLALGRRRRAGRRRGRCVAAFPLLCGGVLRLLEELHVVCRGAELELQPLRLLRLERAADRACLDAAVLHRGHQQVHGLRHLGDVGDHDGVMADCVDRDRRHVDGGVREAEDGRDALAAARDDEVAHAERSSDRLELDLAIQFGRCLGAVGDAELPPLVRQQVADGCVAAALEHRGDARLEDLLLVEDVRRHVLDGQARGQAHEAELLWQGGLVHDRESLHRGGPDEASPQLHDVGLEGDVVRREGAHELGADRQHLVHADDAHRDAEGAGHVLALGVPVLRVPVQKVRLGAELDLDRLLVVALHEGHGGVDLQLALDGLRPVHLDLHRHGPPVVDNDDLTEVVAEDAGLQVILLLLDPDRDVEARAANQHLLLLHVPGIAVPAVVDVELPRGAEAPGRYGHEGEANLRHAVRAELLLDRGPLHQRNHLVLRVGWLQRERCSQRPGVLDREDTSGALAGQHLAKVDHRICIRVLRCDRQDRLLRRAGQGEVDPASFRQNREC
mmetsp:Transcript_81700/g.210346  ORF Transcript_81700/g.210346 Transcript_81700/m.210346 type:complete len:743 (-) Transcript_81700:2207-4435(-)